MARSGVSERTVIAAMMFEGISSAPMPMKVSAAGRSLSLLSNAVPATRKPTVVADSRASFWPPSSSSQLNDA